MIPIVGARTPEQMAQNLGGLDVELTTEQSRRLDQASAPSLGFPQSFLGSGPVRAFSTSGHYEDLDNHRALSYAEFSV